MVAPFVVVGIVIGALKVLDIIEQRQKKTSTQTN